MQALKEGTLLRHGSYRIERILGQGGFGITYLAFDINLRRNVAIKEFFPKDFCERDGLTSQVTLGTKNTTELVNRLKEKFIKEARNIAKFDHPGIIKIHGAFEENNTAYYVMDYIEGQSLSEIVKRYGPIPEQKAIGYIKNVGEALEYVHLHRINHLDVKPANIMVRASDGVPVLIDFGLAKQYDSEGFQTSTTPVGLSHGFAPIEQYKDGGVKEFSAQTDLYSLAATLYYILSGVVPPHATELLEEDLPFPEGIPVNLIGILSQSLSVRKKNRPGSIRNFLEDLNKSAQYKSITNQKSDNALKEKDNEKKTNESWYKINLNRLHAITTIVICIGMLWYFINMVRCSGVIICNYWVFWKFTSCLCCFLFALRLLLNLGTGRYLPFLFVLAVDTLIYKCYDWSIHEYIVFLCQMLVPYSVILGSLIFKTQYKHLRTSNFSLNQIETVWKNRNQMVNTLLSIGLLITLFLGLYGLREVYYGIRYGIEDWGLPILLLSWSFGQLLVTLGYRFGCWAIWFGSLLFYFVYSMMHNTEYGLVALISVIALHLVLMIRKNGQSAFAVMD